MQAGAVHVVNRVNSTIQPNEHPYMNGAWEPVFEEVDVDQLEVIDGVVPTDLPEGVYLRNTENPVHEPIGRYHPFDGDAMLHQVRFHGKGRISYRNRFVRTKAFQAEEEAGKAIWAGLAENPAKSTRQGWGAQGSLKDSSSTDVVVHAGQAMTTFYQCGDGYRLNPLTLETLGIESWKGKFPSQDNGISAHCKVDNTTGELLFFNYSKSAPYMHYGVVDATNTLAHYVPIALPGPRLPHDMAFSKNYTILNDFPLFWDEKLLKKNAYAARYHEHLPSRFAVIPRRGQSEAIRWFEASPTFVLHWLNAYEEINENGHNILVLHGYRQRKPMPDSNQPHAPKVPKGFERMMVYLDLHAMQPQLWCWRFNLTTGSTSEGVLDTDKERVTEFGVIDQRRAGEKHRYVYSAKGLPGWFLLNGFIRHDLQTGTSAEYNFPPDCFCSEAPFVPRCGASARGEEDEDDGYLVSFVTDIRANASYLVILDAQHIERGPVCKLALPHKISSGTHATWASLRQCMPSTSPGNSKL